MARAPEPLDEKTLRISTGKIERAWDELRKHPLTGPLLQRAKLRVMETMPQNPGMFVQVNAGGDIYANPQNHPRPVSEWTFAIAHALLHLAFGHIRKMQRGFVWNIACDCVVNEFLGRMRIGTQPEGFLRLPPGMPNDEEKLYIMLSKGGPLPKGNTTNGAAVDMIAGGQSKANWPDIFARAIRKAAKAALSSAAGDDEEVRPPQMARAWFVKNYPLLGAVLQHLKIVENAKFCERMGVRVAAVSPRKRELILNPGWALDDNELRYVMAHMALHAGLRHAERRKWRDAFLWNAACDYCINSWLTRMPLLMRSCKPPADGFLLAPEFQDRRPEEIYDELLRNEKASRKLITFAGEGVCDLLSQSAAADAAEAEREEVSVDDRLLLDALLRGYQLHTEAGRGPLPYTLLDELKALEHPPLPWDVQLARWFDEHVPPLERVRTYGRPSRRQSSTPNIARPRYVWPDDETAVRSTFGLIVDSSGSLAPKFLSVALSAISMYALSRGIRFVRLVYSGGELNDAGLVTAEELNKPVRISERGSPFMQAGLDVLHADRNFEQDAPVLILTGMPVDKIKTHRDHAFLVKEGARLPYRTNAPLIEVPETIDAQLG